MNSRQDTTAVSPRRSDRKTSAPAVSSGATGSKQRTLMQALRSSMLSISNFQLSPPNPANFPKDDTSTHFTYGERDDSGHSRVFDAQTGVELRRHGDLWFYDGSLVCRAEDTLFRVHMSLLARHSVCFEDMLAIPQPEEELNEKTGFDLSQEKEWRTGSKARARIPIIVLQDSAEDVEYLLKALIDGPTLGNNDRDDFRVVSGILRLSTKYVFELLRSATLAHLSLAWPSTLKGWELREDLAQSYELDHPHKQRLYPHPFLVINLAREVEAPHLLPAAFYDLSRYTYTQIFDPGEDDPFGIYPSLCPMISSSDTQRLCVGKEATQHMITNLIQAMGNSLPNRQPALHSTHAHRRSSNGICMTATNCKKDFSELVDLATQHYLFDRERGSCDPLYVAEELGQLKGAEFSECKACALSLECWASREREKIWRLIPTWFRLDAPVGAATVKANVVTATI